MKNNYVINDLSHLLKVTKEESPWSYVGPVLKRMRRNENWTIQEVSSKYGINQSVISRVENSLIEPNKSVFDRYFEAIGFNLEESLNGFDLESIEADFLDYMLGLKAEFNSLSYGLPKVHYYHELSWYYEHAVNNDYQLMHQELSELMSLMTSSTMKSTQIFLMIMAKYYQKNHKQVKSLAIVKALKANQGLSKKQMLYIGIIELELSLSTSNAMIAFHKMLQVNQQLQTYGLYDTQTNLTKKYLYAFFMRVSNTHLKDFKYGKLEKTVKKLLLYKQLFNQQLNQEVADKIKDSSYYQCLYLLYLDQINDTVTIKDYLSNVKKERRSLFEQCIIEFMVSKYQTDSLDIFFHECFKKKNKYQQAFQTAYYLTNHCKEYLRKIEKYKSACDLIHLNYRYFNELESGLFELQTR
ncbi:putative transcription regulator, contains HTH domain [Paracholeplasma brassicae]|uniref:Putative transcription regulator, contains HTH domain n=1 Tax=Acholeplasma brassicae TaxID=61635 RepID=U4KSR1_9MOLU|nr:helix-turn-helix transcriptional regulator [Paracholeplasma brassicae]CCV65379.1 putative transcription regulator, contains HTH domain [Paracholeplasma brassicae]